MDLGAGHNYRYVNAANVYAKGKADSSKTYTGSVSCYLYHESTKDDVDYWKGYLTITMPDGTKISTPLGASSLVSVGNYAFNISQNFSGTIK